MNKKLYILMVIIGLLLILLAILPMVYIFEATPIGLVLSDDMFNNVLISLGCGIITSTLVSFYIERSNRQIVEEHSMKMKENILNDLIESVKHYSDEDFDFIKIENMIEGSFLKKITHLCDSYIPMGIQFYNDRELESLQKLHYSAMDLCEILEKQNIYELYEKYKDVFLLVVNFNFEHGPYSEEDKIKEICRKLNLDISEIDLCKIGETVYFYHLQKNTCKQFLDTFSSLN